MISAIDKGKGIVLADNKCGFTLPQIEIGSGSDGTQPPLAANMLEGDDVEDWKILGKSCNADQSYL